MPRNNSSSRRNWRKNNRIPKKGAMGVRPRTGGLDLDFLRKDVKTDGGR